MLRLSSLLYLSLFNTSVVLAEPDAGVKVDVFAQHAAGKIVYYYRVFNNSAQNIEAVSIGHNTLNDENPNNDIYELFELPSGWNLKFGIPATSSNSPTGWRISVTAPAESSTHAITWEPLNKNTPRLLPGLSLTKMRVAVDKPDSNYLSGHARVTFSKGIPLNFTVPLDRLDNTPPSLIVNLNPGILRSTDTKPIPIRASFTVKDNYDLRPEIKLVSIIANEPLQPDDIRDASIGVDDRFLRLRAAQTGDAERIYTVTYSATDASGNQTTASATVTVTKEAAAPVAAPIAASAPLATPTIAPAP